MVDITLLLLPHHHIYVNIFERILLDTDFSAHIYKRDLLAKQFYKNLYYQMYNPKLQAISTFPSHNQKIHSIYYPLVMAATYLLIYKSLEEFPNHPFLISCYQGQSSQFSTLRCCCQVILIVAFSDLLLNLRIVIVLILHL